MRFISIVSKFLDDFPKEYRLPSKSGVEFSNDLIPDVILLSKMSYQIRNVWLVEIKKWIDKFLSKDFIKLSVSS